MSARELGISSELPNSEIRDLIGKQGPVIAEVVDILDGGKMGALKVVLYRGAVKGKKQSDLVEYTAEYLPSFFGYTPYDAMDPNNRDWKSTQSSYGMWFVPPDVGTKVVVIFIENNTANRCFWIGCVPESGINHMVPGLAASEAVELTPQEKTKLGTDNVPVMEVNRRIRDQRLDSIDEVKGQYIPLR